MALLEILEVLRDAEDLASTELAWAWRGLSDYIDRRHRLKDREHDDVRQRTLLKVMGAIGRMEADTPGRAAAWLRRVHGSARVDHHRTLGTKLMDDALKTTPKDGDVSFMDRVGPVTDAEDEPQRDEEEALEAALDQVLERAEAWIANNVKSPVKRQGDLRRAQVALLANVRGYDYDAIVAALDISSAPSKGAVYKWIERGREQVLLPALEGWDDPVATALGELLVGARRADAGKARPQRRTAVSRSEKPASSPGRKKK